MHPIWRLSHRICQLWKISTHCAWYLHAMQQVDSCSRVSDMILEQLYCLYCTYALPTLNIHHGSIMAAKILKYLHFGATSCGELETFMSSVLSKETCMRWFVALNVVFMVLYIQVYTKMDNFVPAHLAQVRCTSNRLWTRPFVTLCVFQWTHTKSYPTNSYLILFWFFQHL